MSSDWSLAYSGDPTDPSNSNSNSDNSWGAAWIPDEIVDFPASESKNKDCLIFALDCTTPMFQLNGVYEQHWNNCIKLIIQSIKSKIISSPDDLIGLCLFGTSKLHSNANLFNTVHQLISLSEPSAAMIKTVESLLEPTVIDNIGIGTPESIQLDKCLWTCSSMFTQGINNSNAANNSSSTSFSVLNSYKRIILFTINDTPYSDPGSRNRSIQKGRDLKDLDIQLELLPLNQYQQFTQAEIDSNQNNNNNNNTNPIPVLHYFNPQLFYKDILFQDYLTNTDLSPENLSKHFNDAFEDLRTVLLKKQYKKRAIGSIDLEIGNNIAIKVKLYCLLKEQRRESAVPLDRLTNERLTTETKWVSTDTGAYINPDSGLIKKYYQYGNARIEFTDSELKLIKSTVTNKSGMILMGFKPYNRIKSEYNIKSPYFIYPDESSIKGSTVAFNAFISGLIELKQVAIVRLVYRTGSIPRMAALIPQQEEFNIDGDQSQSPGFHLIFLPYADDCRTLKIEPTPITNEELKLSAKKIVSALTLATFDPTLIPNPVIQQHYSIVEALALDQPAPIEKEDQLWPDEEGMKKHQKLFEDFNSKADKSLGIVRAAAGAAGEGSDDDGTASTAPATKRVKTEVSETEYNSIDWSKESTSGGLKKFTVDKLKLYLRINKLPLSGKKDELIDRIQQHVEQR